MIQRRIIAAAAAACLLLGAAGCSSPAASADTPEVSQSWSAEFVQTDSQPTTLTSMKGTTILQSDVVVPPDDSEDPEAAAGETVSEESAEPSASPAVTTDLVQLQFSEQFMSPGSIEDIDVYNDKVVALTFDDGPHPENTPRLLDVLDANDVPATFFVLGSLVEEYPDIVKRAYEQGCEIGTHSWDHSSNYLKWSQDEVLDQISRTNDAIQEVTGLRTIIDRPPEGAINSERAEAIGRTQILWDVDPNDWKTENRDPDIVYDNVINGGELHDGAIVLSHDIRETTIDAYDRIIKELKDQGYKFVTVTQMMQIADARGKDISYIFNGSPTAASASESAASAGSEESGGEEASE